VEVRVLFGALRNAPCSRGFVGQSRLTGAFAYNPSDRHGLETVLIKRRKTPWRFTYQF
jgi:hypothetical protein